MDTNYDLDVGALEDLCSTLEEPAFLIDKSYNIVWINNAFKKRFDIPLGTNYSHLSRHEIHHPSTMDCLELGKLIKAVIRKDKYAIKLVSLPIKFGSETVSVLQLVEYMDIPDGNHNIMLDTHTAILKLFVNESNDASLLTDKNNVAITFSQGFEREFYRIPEIKDLILRQLDFKNSQDVYDNIQRIMHHSHIVSRKILEDEGKIIGYIYTFKSKGNSGSRLVIPKIAVVKSKSKKSRR